MDGSGNCIEISYGRNIREYNNSIDRTKDKVYYLRAPQPYRYTESDLLELYRWIIINKQFDGAKNNIIKKAVEYLNGFKKEP
jgi:hypothetical protein